MHYLAGLRATERLATPEQLVERIELFGERVAPLGVAVHRVETAAGAVSMVRQLAESIGAEVALLSAELEEVYGSAFVETDDGALRYKVARDPTAARDAPLGVALAKHAIADTGAVVLSEPDLTNRSVGLLSLVLVVIVPTKALLASLEDVATFLRAQAKRPGGAYTTLLTGPSRTADIEMSLTVGVQGPGRLIVVFVDKEPVREGKH